jgi:hypothetical protein
MGDHNPTSVSLAFVVRLALKYWARKPKVAERARR